jgi:hypothetical protein
LCGLLIYLLIGVWSYYFFGLLFAFYFLALVEAFTCELTTRLPTFHLMDVMGICYLQYWLQGDVEDNFNQHLMLIKAHYCFEKLLEPVKTS